MDPRDVVKSRSTGLGIRLIALGTGCALISIFSLVFIAARLSASYADLARAKVDEVIVHDLDHITSGVYNLVESEGNAFAEELSRSLRVAREFLERAGGVSFSAAAESWNAADQFSGRSVRVTLPRVLVGGNWLGRNRDLKVQSPFVDSVADLLGVTVTLFQRMNDRGDMLRVATTVPAADGSRAVGTYIPALMDDGSANPVVKAVLDGGRFIGRAVVVDDWYLTAYESIRSRSGEIVGMLYVGKRQAVIEDRIRSAILETRIGKSGYVYVVSGRGERRGRYVISQDGKRDGEDIWDIVDSDGRYVTRDIIDSALRLKPKELTTVNYRWQNPGERAPRLKIARVAYYAPWDWVIGTSAYEDELGEYRAVLEKGRIRMSLAMAAAGAVILLIIGAISFLVARKVTRPLTSLAAAARAYTDGGEWRTVDVDSYEEAAALASALNAMASRIFETVRVLRKSEDKYRGIYENALEGIFRTSLDGRVVDANPAIARMLGYASPSDMIDSIQDAGEQVYVRSGDRELLFGDILATGVSLGREFLFRRKGGSPFWVSVNAWAHRSEDGSIQSIEGLVTDIDVRKRSEEALRATLTQKEALLREVHHRVKNNLQILVSLLGLQTRFSSNGESLALLNDFADRVRAMSHIHEFVYGSQNLDRVDMLEYARVVAYGLYQTNRASFCEAEILVEGDSLILGLDQAIPCGLLINEIISNSFRHSFPPARVRKGTIRISVSASAGGIAELRISDNGIGLPKDVSPGSGGRLGMTMIPVLAEQIKAELDYLQDNGTSYVIRLRRADLG